MFIKRLAWLACLMSPISAYAIVQGNEVLQSEYDLDYPYMVSVRASVFAEEHYCGGTALSERWILTAAHCLVKSGSSQENSDSNPENITNYDVALPIELSVTHGATDLTNGAEVEVVRVTHVIINPDYYPISTDTTTAYQNDVALLYLETDLPITQFATLVDATTYSDLLDLEDTWDVVLRPSNLSLLGWGETSIDLNSNNLTLNETDATFNPVEDCYSRVESGRDSPEYISSIVDSTKLCSLPTTRFLAGEKVYGNGACIGDGGGPLLFGNIQVGIISASPVSNTVCSSWTIPAWYTNVNHYLAWISSYTDEVDPPTEAVIKPTFLTTVTDPGDGDDDTGGGDTPIDDTQCVGGTPVNVGGGSVELGCSSSNGGESGSLGLVSIMSLLALWRRRTILNN